jgi:hypothetical protein
MNKRLFPLFLAVVFMALPSAVRADDFPRAFVGNFADANGNQLELKSGSAKLKVGGTEYKADADTIESAKVFAKLLKGETKIYIEKGLPSVYDLEAYWVIPDQKSKVQYGEVVYFKATVIYFRIPRSGSGTTMTVLRSDDGMVSLDTLTKRWQVGWGERRMVYTLNRVVKSGK